MPTISPEVNSEEKPSTQLVADAAREGLDPVTAMAQAIARFNESLKKLTKIEAKAAPEKAWGAFRSLPRSTQWELVSMVESQASFMEGALEQNIDGCDEVAMLKYAVRRLSLDAEDEVLNEIRSGDVVEIFDQNHTQIYRSYSCFSLCNYSLLELAAYPWFDLYERSSLVAKNLIDISNAILSGASFIRLNNFPEYSLREALTEERALFALQERFMALIKSAVNGQNYILSVKTVREVPTENATNVVRFL